MCSKKFPHSTNTPLVINFIFQSVFFQVKDDTIIAMIEDKVDNRVRKFDIRTQSIAKERKLSADTVLYRWLHPATIVGIDGQGNLLLRGNRYNNTRVVDEYSDVEKKTRASALEQPGLNFTTSYDDTYKDETRRVPVSFSWADQDASLKIYSDLGSQVRSLYFTLPENTFYKVKAREINIHEISLSLLMHKMMKAIGLVEEPLYLGFLDDPDKRGVSVTLYLPVEGGKKESEIIFEELQNGVYKVDITRVNNENIKILEFISLLRILVDLPQFKSISLSDGTTYSFQDLQEMVAQSEEYQIVQNIQTQVG